MGNKSKARRAQLIYRQGLDAADGLLREIRARDLERRIAAALGRELEPSQAPTASNPYRPDSENWGFWRAGFLSRFDPLGAGAGDAKGEQP